MNSKVTGRVAWIGVEKGDKVKEGQVLVRLEDEEFRALYEQSRGAWESAKARLAEAQHGSRPEEIQQADHNLAEARATAANDKITLDRNRDLFAQGVVSKQNLDDAQAKYDADQQRANSLEQSFSLSKLGPRAEEIDRAKADVDTAKGQMDYTKSQLDATVIRAPVTGTILERTAEKGELVTAQFASGAEGGRAARSSRSPISTTFRSNSTSRRTISPSSHRTRRASSRSTLSRTARTKARSQRCHRKRIVRRQRCK